MVEGKQYYLILVLQILIFSFLFSLQSLTFSQPLSDKINKSDTLIIPENENLDTKILRKINNLRNPFLDKIIYHTDIACIPICLTTPLVMFTTSKLNNNYYDESSATLLTLSEFSTIMTTFILKDLVKRERPIRKIKNLKHTKADETFLDTYSFPSGHSSLSFCFATSLSLRYPDKPFLIAGLFTYSTLVAFGRIYIGVHYPSDVIAGMLIGTGSAILIHSLKKEIIGNYDINHINDKVNSDNSPSSMIFFSFAITEGLNYLLYKNNINASSRFFFTSDNKFLNFSLSF